MYLGKSDVNTYDKGVEREFLVSNGCGNYGSSTVVGANTRREHGLLVTRSKGAARHMVLVSKIEETLYAQNRKYQLSTNRYKDLVYPDGYRYLQEYQGTPIPTMLFVIHSIFLRKSIFMPKDETCTVVKYELVASPEPVRMDLRPLFAHRINNETAGPGEKAEFTSSRSDDGVIDVTGGGATSYASLASSAAAPSWSKKPLWFESIIYERDGLPGEATPDSLFSPGYGSFTMSQGDVAYVVLSETAKVYTPQELQAMENAERERIAAFVAGAPLPKNYSAVRDMVQSSTHLVAEGGETSAAIFSGFPSVELRARDTFIALPGLTLATGRRSAARDVLTRWQNESQDGIMPGSIDYAGKPVFDEIDSGLWFVYAVGKYAAADESEDVSELARSAFAVLDRHAESAPQLGLALDPETKLLTYLNDGTLRHWMSGIAGGEPLVTRKGCLVEINALWYSALRTGESLALRLGERARAEAYAESAEVCRASFPQVFWNEEKRYLYDWVCGEEKDDAIRPSALLAVSLPHPVLADDLGRQVLQTCWDELYTTYGLRTLDPHHEKFKGRAEGRPDQKKKARLRGMAWPWLLGQFVSAYVRFNPDSQEIAWSFLRPFSSHLRRGCVGGVAEYFDGVMPYRPNGDVLSAISLGELLRSLHEDLGEDIGDI